MTSALISRFSLDILLSSATAKIEGGDKAAIYHPGDTISGFLKITGYANTVLDNMSLALEGESNAGKLTYVDVMIEKCAGTVRIWHGRIVDEEGCFIANHRVSALLSISRVTQAAPR